jgi:pyrimidine operon attenuation protein / uracil phosphoribosyltransferase
MLSAFPYSEGKVFFAPMIKQLLNKQDLDRILSRIAHEIIERNKGVQDLCIIGIQRGGVPLAYRLAGKIESIKSAVLPVGALDISSHRDDKDMRPLQSDAGRTLIPFDISGKKIIVVDDVIFTGRTIRAAMDALMDYGRPARIQFFVLIDRGHRELPVKPDYVGKNIPTMLPDNINVLIGQDGLEDAVLLESPDG